MPIKDNTAAWLKEGRDELGKRLEKALIFLQNQTKTALSIKGPPRSLAGEFPDIESGKLRQSITHITDNEALIGWLGTNLIYARYLAGGTQYMEPRKLFEDIVEANQGALKAILKG
jgi:hypothetical protein